MLNTKLVALQITICVAVLCAGLPRCFGADGANSKVIPIDRVWAYNIAGTKNIHDLDDKFDDRKFSEQVKDKPVGERERLLKAEVLRKSVVAQIVESLRHLRRKVEPGFVVTGTGRTALLNAQKVFAQRTTATEAGSMDVLPAKTELSLVWFTTFCGHYAQLVAIQRTEEGITVQYRFISHQKAMMSSYFAIIPIGSMPTGTYQVNFEELPATDELGRPVGRQPNCSVSSSFSFGISE
jgi:hypothetical protein